MLPLITTGNGEKSIHQTTNALLSNSMTFRIGGRNQNINECSNVYKYLNIWFAEPKHCTKL